MSADGQVTNLLARWKDGDKAALDLLTPLIYDELRRLAAHYLRDERNAPTLQPTVLVHEAYLKLAGGELPDWESRAHFFGVAAHRMRQILVDHARKHVAGKRGGGQRAASLDEALNFAPERSAGIIALDDALGGLAAFDERKARVIELRYFGGMSIEETAQALGISVATVGREQRFAEAWLQKYMTESPAP